MTKPFLLLQLSDPHVGATWGDGDPVAGLSTAVESVRRRQTLEAAVRWGFMSRNPAKLAGSNPQPRLPEIEPFSRAEVDRLAVEFGSWGPIAIVASETGLRPSEWICARVVGRVSRRWRRTRPAHVLPWPFEGVRQDGAVAPAPTALDTRARRDRLDPAPDQLPALFPAPGGGNRVRAGHGRHLDLHNWRAREWLPALDAAGLPRRRIYDLRHSFATRALAAGLSIFELARYMGTSVDMIDRTYGHLARGSEELARDKLDAHAATDMDRLGQDRATP
jgi:hypothetical protein